MGTVNILGMGLDTVDTQEVGTQEVGTQEVVIQEVDTQEVDIQEVGTQEVDMALTQADIQDIQGMDQRVDIQGSVDIQRVGQPKREKCRHWKMRMTML